jgi:Tfp pilus assembly protein PilF
MRFIPGFISGAPVTSIRTLALGGALAAVAFLTSGCNKLQARDNLNKGVNAFKSGQYSAAADDFKTAIDLDPDFPVARLYLATAYMQQYVPGSDTPENKRNADAALDQFQKVIEDPKSTAENRLLATQSMASLYFNLKDFTKAEDWNKKILAADPNNKEAYYVLGVIAWTNFVVPDREARLLQSMTPEAPGPLKDPKGKKDPDTKAELKAKYWPTLTAGIEDEKKALAIDPEYENAMSYMNLLVRYRGDLEDTKEQYQADAKEADGWISKAMETTKKKAAKKSAAAEQTQ